MKGSAGGPRFDDSLEHEFDRGMREVLPGYVPLDSDLELDGGRVATRVGVGPEGQLVLALDARDRADREPDVVVLDVLDALAWARGHRALLARHLAEPDPQAPAIDASAEPLVVLVCDDVSPGVARRLEALPRASVLLLERRVLASSGARSSFLVPVVAGAPVPPDDALESAADAARAATGFLERLDEERHRRADELLRRLRRLDEELACAGAETGLRWSYRGTELCELGEDARGLVGRVAGLEEPHLLGADDALETFLDAALARYLRLSRELEEGVGGLAASPG